MMKSKGLVRLVVIVFCCGLVGCTSDSGSDDSQAEIPPEVIDGGSDVPLVTSAGEIQDFLWKPQADGGYNTGLLVVLVDPCEVAVIVNGDELIDFGPSNGRCTTARSLSKSGCAYGANVKVQVLDRLTRLPYLFPGGLDTYTIPNGCNRTEFKL